MEQLTITVNGKEHNVLVAPGETLAKTLRDRLQLTGTKTGCEEGSCGCCTVSVNDWPVLSCLSPALRHQGAHIETIEGLAKNGILHPVQEQFIEKGAIQCGYCTPGMIMTARAFLKENPRPTRKEVKEAISGNLCRCTGYKKIVDAILAASSGKFSPDKNNRPANKGHNVIGKYQPLLDAKKKATGEAEFTDDIMLKNTLYAKLLRSPQPHARILSIDTSKAEEIKGVRAVATGKDLQGKFGVLPISHDQTAMAVDKVRYQGEIVAAVAADSEDIANEALKNIKVKYRPIIPFLSWKESLQPAPDDELIHDYSKKYGANIQKKVDMEFGNVEEDHKNAAHITEQTFDFPGLNHAFTEPHSAIANWDKYNKLTLYTATQVPHYVHRTLSKVLQLPLENIRVIKPFVGGGFGGKSDPFSHELIVSLLSKKTGKPVKIRFSREEVFLTNHGRHPSHIKTRLGMDKKGNFRAASADIVIDGGAFGSFGVVTAYYNGVLLQAPYQLNSFGFQSQRVYTNKPPSGAMRGHGGVNARFAMEVTIDELARKAGMDPCELRIKNFLPEKTHTLGQFRITSNGIRESLERVMKDSQWKKKYDNLPGGHGIGVACGFFISGSALPIIWNEYPQSVVHLKLDFDGRVVIYSGASDIGQGSDTMLAMIVAETLGIDPDKTYVHSADTLFTPVDLGSYSSRVTFMAGNAAKMAAEKLKEKLIKAASKKHGVNADQLDIKNGMLTGKNSKLSLSWKELVDIATAWKGALNTSGYYISPKLGGDFKGSGAGLSPSYSFGALIAEVKVNSQTGETAVINMWGAHDCGKAINPLAVEGQLEGSWHMGMGQALNEGMEYYEGLLLNSSLLNYKIPTSADTPDFNTHIIETSDPEGPFEAKECGEGALLPAVPAIANAIYDATGVRINRLPVTPDKIIDGLRQKAKKEQEKAETIQPTRKK